MRKAIYKKILLDSVIIMAISLAAAFAVNALRGDGIPLRAPLLLHPQCRGGQGAKALKLSEALSFLEDKETLFADIRPRADFLSSHIKGAVSLPYSLLEPYAEEDLAPLRRIRRVIIYGLDGADGRAFAAAAELLEAGIRGACVLEGGLLEWRRAGGRTEGEGLAEK
jgi:rhodanese-related sulfurtransferase